MGIDVGPIEVTDGLIVHLDGGNSRSYSGSGTSILSLSGLGNTGILINGPTFSSSNGGQIIFDGTNDYIKLPVNNAYNLNNGSLTVEVFYSIINPIIGERMILEHNVWNAAGLYQLTFATNNVYRLVFPEAWNLGQQLDYTDTNLELNKWTHVVATFNTSTNTSRLYINTQLKTERTDITAELGNSTSDIFIFCRNGTGLFLAAKLGHIKLYNRALTSTEVLQNYHATKGRYK
jgi:hypothetical protein